MQQLVASQKKTYHGRPSSKMDHCFKPIGSMYGIYANIEGILMVNVTIYSIHGSYGKGNQLIFGYHLQPICIPLLRRLVMLCLCG